MPSLYDNQARGRYELSEQGAMVFADYRRVGDRLFIDHVEAPPQLRGTGAAGRFMEALVAEAKVKGLTLVPICSYAVHWLRTHTELARDVSIDRN
jgi:predicted GNAT family acetyltransferase